jgi:hypothetical protein
MIGLIPPIRIISTVAVLYAALTIVIAWFLWNPSTTLFSSVKIAFAGAAALNIFLVVMLYFGWRWLWLKLPFLNKALFPDLNGNWHMKIHWTGTQGNGVIEAMATIKQDMLRISMEVAAPDSDSETLLAKPSRDSESGRPILYYIYRVVPKQTIAEAGHSYEGAAILRFSHTGIDSLKGNYFTSRQTKGYFECFRKHPSPCA